MKKYVNGNYVDMSAEEISAMRSAQRAAEALERTRPLSLEEVQTMLIRQQVNTLAVDDATALRMAAFYPDWKSGTAYTTANGCPVGYKVVQSGKLYKLRQEHTSQDSWAPGMTGTESLWERIDETHDGTKYDPIPYDGNMALEAGKYYMQDGAVYLCTRDTVNPVYNLLTDLVGIYVENT